MTAPIRAEFALTDHHGQPVTLEHYRGRWALVLFGFTHCRAVCPRALSRLETVLDQLGPLAERITPLYLTVDPDRDTPERMRAFLADYPRFTGLTGTTEQTEQAKRAFRVFARRKADPDDPDGYAVPHTAITYLLDRDGVYAAHFADSRGPDDVAREIASIIGA